MTKEEIIKEFEDRFVQAEGDIGYFGWEIETSFGDVKQFLERALAQQKDEMAIEKAEQQLLGFKHGKQGYDLTSLIESMGLTLKEWEVMKNIFSLEYLTDEDKQDIEKAIKN